MKILVYSHYFLPSVGGVERLVDSLARGFAERGHKVSVAAMTPAGAFDDAGLPYTVVRCPGFATLLRLIRHHDVTHLAGPALLPMFLAYFLRKPVTVEHHVYQAICPNGLLVFQPDQSVCPGHFMARRHRECLRCNAARGRVRSLRMWLLAFPRLWLCRRVAANVAVTEHVRCRLQLPNSRLIYHGTATTNSAGRGSAAAAEGGSVPCFAYVGRFVGEKGLPLLIEAGGRLKLDGLSFHLKLIGDGPLRASLEAAVRSHGLQDRTTFTGMLGPGDLRRETASVTALVMPSTWEETAGLAAIEQMMRGRALIVSEIGGLSEVVGDAGLKFPVGDAPALAACMNRLIQDPSLARRLGESARQRALAHFSRNDMIEAHLQVYRELSPGNVGRRGPAARAAEENPK